MITAVDNKKCVLLVMLNLRAAFDTIYHHLLLLRLQSDCGITGNTLASLGSYFNQRTRVADGNGHLSKPKQVNTGLYHGSIIGPFSFKLYAAPLFRIARKHGIHVHMYADDMQFYLQFNPSVYANVKCQKC